MFKKKRTAFLVSGPSGVGKTTIVRKILEDLPWLAKVITTTSRPKRAEEHQGVHYHFVSRDEFQTMAADSKFVEWKKHFGNYYGLTWSALYEHSDQDVIFDVDTEGMREILSRVDEDIVTIFLSLPSREDLNDRLTKRGDLSIDEINLRLAKSANEIAMAKAYDYEIENVELNSTLEKLQTIILCNRRK